MAFRRSAALVSLSLVFSLAAVRADAQLARFGPSGVVMGHVHLNVRDIEAERKFWIAVGATPVQNGQLQLLAFPGVFVMLRQQAPTGGSVGSTVNHFGFLVKNIQESIARWQAAGLKMDPQTRRDQVFLISPDEARIEILEDTTIGAPIQMHHVHFYVTDPLAVQAWYKKTFGAVPGKRGQFDAADLPGVNLTFTKADQPQAAIKGRAVDHIGFEVNGLEGFLKTLAADGITLDRPYQKLPGIATAIAFLTDPWGTQIELTEHLAP